MRGESEGGGFPVAETAGDPQKKTSGGVAPIHLRKRATASEAVESRVECISILHTKTGFDYTVGVVGCQSIHRVCDKKLFAS